MHLLAAKPGGYTDDEGIIDLGQTPGDIVILSAADSSLAALAGAVETLPADFPTVRLANWMQLQKPAAFDLYQHKVLDHARVVLVSLLGGENYWRYGFERLLDWAARSTPAEPRQLILVPGDDAPDPALFEASNCRREHCQRAWHYLREGGATNLHQLLCFLADEYLQRDYGWREPQHLPRCLLYMPGVSGPATFEEWVHRWQQTNTGERCLLLFYRSHLQSGNTGMFDQLIETLEATGISPLPIAIASLKDAESLALVNALLEQSAARLIVNTTGFASQTVSSPDLAAEPTRFQSPFVRPLPVLQLILSGSTEEDWATHQQGLRSRDIAMQVVLPEMDGRIITRAISFKSEAFVAERSQVSVVKYQLHAERAAFVAALAQKTLRLATLPNDKKRIALMLANYPTRDGRIGNGVGLDTPASVINLLRAMQQAGYPVDAVMPDGNALIAEILGAVTNNPATLHQLPCWQSIALEDYRRHFDALPTPARDAVLERWGEPERDPKCRQGRLMIAGIRLGETFIGIQPARGFNLDLAANYHDPDLVPPHSYLACYFLVASRVWCRCAGSRRQARQPRMVAGQGQRLVEYLLARYCAWPDAAFLPVYRQ